MRMPLCMPHIPYPSTWVRIMTLLLFQLPANAHLGRHQVRAQVVGSLPLYLGGLGSVPSHWSWPVSAPAFVGESVEERYVFFSLCLSNKHILFFKKDECKNNCMETLKSQSLLRFTFTEYMYLLVFIVQASPEWFSGNVWPVALKIHRIICSGPVRVTESRTWNSIHLQQANF